MTPLAVLIIHGVEIEDPNFHLTPQRLLEKHFGRQLRGHPKQALVIEPVHWAPVLEPAERKLFARGFKDEPGGFFDELRRLIWRINHGSETALVPLLGLLMRRKDRRLGRLHYPGARWVMMHFVGDAIAYQPGTGNREVYDGIHNKVAEALVRLRQRAGGTAPLCVLAHSLGSVIASNYFYDLQAERTSQQQVRDERVNLQGPLFGWSPLVHPFYWSDDAVMKPIANALARTWQHVNAPRGTREWRAEPPESSIHSA